MTLRYLAASHFRARRPCRHMAAGYFGARQGLGDVAASHFGTRKGCRHAAEGLSASKITLRRAAESLSSSPTTPPPYGFVPFWSKITLRQRSFGVVALFLFVPAALTRVLRLGGNHRGILPRPLHTMEEHHPNSPTGRPKSWRHRVFVPSILAPAIDERIDELKRESFSQHAIETVCFDLRIRRPHAVTGQFAREVPKVQDAIDRFTVANYRPKAERDEGTLCRLIFNTLPPLTRWQQKVGEGPGDPEKREVFYPPLIVEKIEERWQELGFESLSEYVTSVMRYDLLLGGKHRQFPHNDFHPDILEALDRETLNEFLKNRKPKIKLDYLLEEAAGRELTREECEEVLVAIAKKIKKLAMEYFL
jgi:hypothetical protein